MEYGESHLKVWQKSLLCLPVRIYEIAAIRLPVTLG